MGKTESEYLSRAWTLAVSVCVRILGQEHETLCDKISQCVYLQKCSKTVCVCVCGYAAGKQSFIRVDNHDNQLVVKTRTLTFLRQH